MAYRFVHAADIHLDSPLRSLALRSPDLAALIGDATRQALIRIVDLCLDERVDALLLAGDLYDGEQTSMKTARFLADQIRRLHTAGIRVFVIRGNHDALSKITKELVFPDTVTVFGGRADTVAIDRDGDRFSVAIHGLSFSQAQAPESLLAKYRLAVEGAVNIGILHTSLAGAEGHDLYAPCSPADLRATGFRYWALGHIHKRSVLEGDCTIVMPGMPQGRDINEAGPKSVSLVTIGDDRAIRVEERAIGVAQFERVTVDATGIAEWRDLIGAVGSALEAARMRVAAQHLVARLHLTGTTPLAWRMRRDGDLLKAEAEAHAGLVGACWIEKLEIACTQPGDASPSRSDPLHELRRLIDDEVLASDAFRKELAGIADELKGQLPPECRDSFGSDRASYETLLARHAREGTDAVLARLHALDERG
ncbi:metallophosphoesterase family protein [Methylobacterium haplocladii]|uniref:Serine/threonine phosphatase n=1 Tax=Methylobacterium haplocladii TaxID=1176176 RepID=A0A512ILF7_9HYPH|nr:DNA repair exonuclease [Methylobacterium haplocladii]GEO98546.1 serine/threonine phosphatase [Methylobacterium haplocladii]GJD85173.1 3',5'-cyclic adenosine monophosphate phosphodiesterase CpdA [Methylobacterium haplocladii]GLS59892.1 serine/threonine phosphatase [Methylobacterium haplocladii]